MTLRRLPRLMAVLLLGVTGAVSAQRPQSSLLPALPASTRVAGLAGAGVANIGHAGTVFENPSGLAPIRTLSIEAALYRRLGGATYNMGAAAVRVGAFNLGGGYQYLVYPAGSATRDNVQRVGALTWRRGGLARVDYAYRGSAHGGRPPHLFGLRWTR